jgi:hypothetical protein
LVERHFLHVTAINNVEPQGLDQAIPPYLAVWRLYTITIGRWPVMSSPKVEGYAEAQTAFAAYERLVTPAIEPLLIPFEGRYIKLWLRKPAGAARPPVTVNIGGSWKDSVAIQARGFLPHGIAAIAIDKPRIADAPVRCGPAPSSRRSSITSSRAPISTAAALSCAAKAGAATVPTRRLCETRPAQGRCSRAAPVPPLFPARMAAGDVQDPGLPVRLRAVAAAQARRCPDRRARLSA